jgi:PAS domain S-box-containing protein
MSQAASTGDKQDAILLDIDLEEARPTFLSIARIAKDLTGASFGAIGLLQKGGRWVASVDERAASTRSPHGALIQHAAVDGSLWIGDAQAATALAALNVRRTGLRFFASAPIHLAGGEHIGAVMVGGQAPRPHSPAIASRLEDLAALIGDECERRRAFKELAEHEAAARALSQRMASMVQGSPVALIMTDRDLRVLQVSARWLAETGLSEERVVGRSIYDIIPGLRADYDRHYQAALAGETLRTNRARLIAPDGSTRWLRAETKPWHAPDGDVGGLLIMSYDVTDMVEALNAAEAGNRAKSEFLTNMSHEIRTPLNGVMGPAGVLAKTELTPPQKEMVTLIESSANVLGTLLGDLLDLARAESGDLELRDDVFDLWEVIEAVGHTHRSMAEGKSLAFQVVVPARVSGWVRGDKGALRQIICSLLSNAVKFTNEGSIRIDATAVAEGERLRLALTVADTGVGFDKAQASRLFQRFETGDGSLTRERGGSGVGLALSQAYARALGGTLECQSTPGVGSTFTLRLDLTRSPAEHDMAPSGLAEENDAARPLRVLLAEDHPVNRKVVAVILQMVGADLTAVENGAEAVAAFETGEFDLVLMDMQMPVMDGLTAIRRIREVERERGSLRIPILTLTANAMPEHTRASYSAGADAYLTKPVTPEGLIAAIQGILEGSRRETPQAEVSAPSERFG